MTENDNKINFVVHNIYVKDISFEAPHSPKVFTLDWKPKLEFEIETGRSKLEGALHEVVISITVKVKVEQPNATVPENLTAFIVEVKQAGIFMLEGVVDPQQVDYILATAAPNILFPYARQIISILVTQGGFPQLIVPPMNFEAMYQQHLMEREPMTEAAN